jgi:Sortase family.
MASERRSILLTTPSFLLSLALLLGSAAPAIARDARTTAAGALGGSAAWSDAVARFGVTAERQVQPQAAVRPPTPDVPVAQPVSVSRTTAPTPAKTTRPAAAAATYDGRNHVWIPRLGVSRSITFFSCTSKAYPGDRVYRWGCAGSNNVYLFGHAGSVFKPLHDAYESGRLAKGMALYYAGDDGVVHAYTVRWWKVTTPDKGAWAYASQSTPSLTLQTCVGTRGQYRLVVRLSRTN